MSELNNYAGDLKASPLFNLSLVNKELFHSNFIAWFGHFYPSLFVELINEVLAGDYKNWNAGLTSDNIVIRREYKHFDISVFSGNDKKQQPRLVIENKVKSEPDFEQLARYAEAIGEENDTALILLTTNYEFKDKHVTPDHNLRWKIIDYKQLSEALAKLNSRVKDEYHRLLVADYCKYINALQDVISGCFGDPDKCRFINVQENEKYKKLGIYDICSKRKAHNISELLNRKLEEANISTDKVKVEYNYTKDILIEVRIKTNSAADEYVIIQLQGKQYRHAVLFNCEADLSNSSGLSNKGIDYLKNNYGQILLGDQALGNYPRLSDRPNKFGQRGGQEKCCRFHIKALTEPRFFVYQWVSIPDQITITAMVDVIVKDTKNLLEIMKLSTDA